MANYCHNILEIIGEVSSCDIATLSKGIERIKDNVHQFGSKWETPLEEVVELSRCNRNVIFVLRYTEGMMDISGIYVIRDGSVLADMELTYAERCLIMGEFMDWENFNE